MDIFDELCKFFLEQNFNRVGDNVASPELLRDYLDLIVELNNTNQDLIDFLKAYARNNLEINFDQIDQGRGDPYFNKQVLENNFNKANACQLYDYIVFKTTSEKSPFTLSEGHKMIYHRDQVKNFNIQNKKIRTFSLKTFQETSYDKLYFDGYYYIYQNTKPLVGWENGIEGLMYLHDALGMEKDEFLQNYLLELMEVDGIFFEEDRAIISTKALQKLELIGFTQPQDIVSFYKDVMTTRKLSFLSRLIFAGKSELLRQIAEVYRLPDYIIRNIYLNPETKSVLEDKAKRPHLWPRTQSKCQIVKFKCNKKNHKILSKFKNLAVNQIDFHLPLNCDYRLGLKEYRLVSYQEIGDRTLLCGGMVYAQIGNIYYVRNLATQSIRNIYTQGTGTALIKRLIDEAKRKGIKFIALSPLDTALGFYRKMGFSPLEYFDSYLYLEIE